MSEKVRVPYGDSASDTATLLLAAAEEKNLDPSVIEVSSLGGFLAPEEVAKQAGVEYEDPEEADGSKYSEKQVDEAAETPLEGSQGPIEPVADEAPKPAKRTAAKKSTTKKGK